jgi:pyruvate dehydrogenase E2 component (dihydrolipoyllysine-residue acetyltransferase)
MAISVVMPALEMAQETGKLISWLKKEGESVAKGEPLLEIETDKAVMEIESPGEGVLAGIKVQAGAEVPVGQTIAWIVLPGETPPTDEVTAASGRKITSTLATSASANPPAAQASATTQSPTQPVKISPKARRLATEQRVDLANVRGSGAGGEILASDILAAAEAKTSAVVAPQPADGGSAISRLMAERTTQSWTTVPHFFVIRDVDASALNAARQNLGADVEKAGAVKLTHTDLLIALVARVLRKHSRLNASWTGESVRANADINIGVAMAVADGVVAPVIRHADKIKLSEIALQRRDLTERARSGKLRPADLAGGTFTISNLGMFGVDAFTAIIIPPQAEILAIGAIADRVVPVGVGSNPQPGIRPMMTLTLSSDHRVVDGARAAEFMRDLVEALGSPQQYLDR